MIYFIRCDNSVKIGHSKEPLKRLSSLQTGNPRPLSILRTEEGGVTEEAEYHARFSALRIARTEWFHLTGELESFLGSACQHKKQAEWPSTGHDKSKLWLGPSPDGIGKESFDAVSSKCPAGAVVLDLTHGCVDWRAELALEWLITGHDGEDDIRTFLDWASPEYLALWLDGDSWTVRLIYIPSMERDGDDLINNYAPPSEHHGEILRLWWLFDCEDPSISIELRMFWSEDDPLCVVPLHHLNRRPIVDPAGTALVPIPGDFEWATGNEPVWIPAEAPQ